ncbi:unnamed protein product, partial [Prorocentrum cordatum]
MSAQQPDRWLWVLYVGDPLWHQRMEWRLAICTPDGDVHDGDYSGMSADIAAIRVCSDRSRPPGITAQDSFRFRRAPTAAGITAFQAAGETCAAAALASEAAVAGQPFVAPAAGCVAPLPADGVDGAAAAGPAPAAHGAGAGALLPAAPGTAAPAAALAGTAVGAPATLALNWVVIERTTFAKRGETVLPLANAVAQGDLAIVQTPSGLSVALRNIHAMDAGVFATLESVRNPRILDGSAH